MDDSTKKAEIAKLQKRMTDKRCGDCSKWMIARHCKREANHKVHMNEYPCNDWSPGGFYLHDEKNLIALTL